LDYSHPEVCEDVTNWGKWIVDEIPGLRGFRLDAVQHFSQRFTKEWIEALRQEHGDLFYVGEFWQNEVQGLVDWVNKMERKFSLYDSPLVNNFSKISTSEAADLRKVFDDTLVQAMPVNAVVSTFLLYMTFLPYMSFLAKRNFMRLQNFPPKYHQAHYANNTFYNTDRSRQS
jgi:alpha-amylase